MDYRGRLGTGLLSHLHRTLSLCLGLPPICLFLHMPHLPDAFSLMIMGNHTLLVVMVHLVCFVHMPLTISDHLRLRPPTLQFHSDTHCISSHNHATPVAGLNSDQCLISPAFVPMSWAATYLSFSPYAAFA